jgi:hypothetical protein
MFFAFSKHYLEKAKDFVLLAAGMKELARRA